MPLKNYCNTATAEYWYTQLDGLCFMYVTDRQDRKFLMGSDLFRGTIWIQLRVIETSPFSLSHGTRAIGTPRASRLRLLLNLCQTPAFCVIVQCRRMMSYTTDE